LIDDAAHAVEAVSRSGKVGSTADFTLLQLLRNERPHHRRGWRGHDHVPLSAATSDCDVESIISALADLLA